MSEVNDTKTHRGAFAVLNMWPELKLENWSEQSACASQTNSGRPLFWVGGKCVNWPVMLPLIK